MSKKLFTTGEGGGCKYEIFLTIYCKAKHLLSQNAKLKVRKSKSSFLQPHPLLKNWGCGLQEHLKGKSNLSQFPAKLPSFNRYIQLFGSNSPCAVPHSQKVGVRRTPISNSGGATAPPAPLVGAPLVFWLSKSKFSLNFYCNSSFPLDS